MKNYSLNLYQVLKAFEIASCNNNFDYEKTLDLEQLKITENELLIIIDNIIDSGFIKGIIIIPGCSGFKAINPHLTNLGYDFLENNSTMKKAYSTLKEIKGWIPGL